MYQNFVLFEVSKRLRSVQKDKVFGILNYFNIYPILCSFLCIDSSSEMLVVDDITLKKINA